MSKRKMFAISLLSCGAALVLLGVLIFRLNSQTSTVGAAEEAAEPVHKIDTTESTIESNENASDNNLLAFMFDKAEEVFDNTPAKPLSDDYYFQYMLKRAKENDIINPLFSPESMNIALDMHSELLTEEDKTKVKEQLDNVDYLNFKGSDVFKITNRIWMNNQKDIHPEVNPKLEEFAYMLDMSAPRATQEKDDFVSEQTNGFITSTPTEFTMDTVFDSMNILYFKDIWRDGDKHLDINTTDFHNANGTITPLCMFHDGGGRVMKSSNAYSYTMPYEHNYDFTVIIPIEDDTDLSKVKISDFFSDGKNQPKAEVLTDYQTSLTMPEFESETKFKIDPADIEVGGTIDPAIYTPEPGDDITTAISQVCKIVVDHTGTEAAAVTEIMDEMETCAIEPINDRIDIVCDRPFIYMMTDNNNEIIGEKYAKPTIMFIGVVNQL